MSSLGDRLRARAAPVVAPPPPKAKAFSFGVGPRVGWSVDLERVLAIPRRPQDIPALAPEDAVDALMAELGRPSGTRRLRPVQAAALLEAQRTGGLLAPIGVGKGKTDISLLLPVVLKSRVAVLLVPPALKAKLVDKEYPYLVTQYRLPQLVGSNVMSPGASGVVHVVSYSQLSSAKGADVLDRLKPDLVVCDEAHCLKHPGATRTKRFLRYFKANLGVRLCALSGTLTTKSIRDFAHLARFALKQGAPVPFAWPVLEEWRAALDPGDFPADPGELLRLCWDDEDVRSGYRRRLMESPGVVGSPEGQIATSLILHERPLKPTKAVQDALADLRGSWCTPGGEELTDALSMHRAGRQLACGFYLKWVWPDVVDRGFRREWLDARKEWHREIRDMLKGDAKPGMDSPLLLARAATSGKWSSVHFARWRNAHHHYRDLTGQSHPDTVAVWVDDYLVRDAVEWGRKHVGIIWYEHKDVGPLIAQLGGFTLYGPGKDSAAKIGQEAGDRTIVVSINSHRAGHNLQAFNQMLYTSFPTSATTVEQSLGRCHRDGQTADEVEAFLYLHTPEMRAALEGAMEDAQFVQSITGEIQKLSYCTFSFSL